MSHSTDGGHTWATSPVGVSIPTFSSVGIDLLPSLGRRPPQLLAWTSVGGPYLSRDAVHWTGLRQPTRDGPTRLLAAAFTPRGDIQLLRLVHPAVANGLPAVSCSSYTRLTTYVGPKHIPTDALLPSGPLGTLVGVLDVRLVGSPTAAATYLGGGTFRTATADCSYTTLPLTTSIHGG